MYHENVLIIFGCRVARWFLYYVLNVKSPAPPLVALVGLLGMVIGEQLLPFIKSYF